MVAHPVVSAPDQPPPAPGSATTHLAVAAAAAPPVGAGPPQPADTTVNVTIGRIDVRAVPAPGPPANRPALPAAPVSSLDDYLRQRTEGSRP
jgi:hypothetical protein